MKAHLITTSFDLPGHKIIRTIGVARGIVVRSRSIIGAAMAGFQTILGGNITVYTNMCEKARTDAYNLMCQQAERNGANAMVMVRYDATEVMRGVTEVLCYGTAVVVEESA